MCRAQEAPGFIKCKLKVFSQSKDCIFQSVGLGFLNLVLSVGCVKSVACLRERPVCQSLSVVCLLQMSVYPWHPPGVRKQSVRQASLSASSGGGSWGAPWRGSLSATSEEPACLQPSFCHNLPHILQSSRPGFPQP